MPILPTGFRREIAAMTKDQYGPPPVPKTEPNQKQQRAAASSQAELDAFLGQAKALDAAVQS